jgi:uncharacterized iron-regulated membrane protein
MNALPSSATADPTSALYRAVWRWHFYAGVLVAPFAIFLAFTGAIYLWQPQYEAWRYHDLLTASTSTAPSTWSSSDAQLAAAIAAAPPHSHPKTFQPAFHPGETTQVIFSPAHASSPAPSSDSQISNLKSEIPPPAAAHHAAATTVFIDPPTVHVLGQLHDDDRLMNTVKKLHSSLLIGKSGEYLVELVASWALVLFLTGLYLAWPRPRFTVFGFLLPRLRAKGRVFWRDLHAVPAIWLATASIFLLSTGLLWTNSAGAWYRTLSAALGQGTPRESAAGAHRSELTGWSPPLRPGLANKIDALASTPPPSTNLEPAHAHAGHHAHHAPAAPLAEGPFEHTLPLDHIVALAREHHVPEPFAIALPVGPSGVYSVLSDRTQPFKRAYLHVDQYSGRILADVRFKDFGYLAQFFSWGIVAHEGQLFGLANQILGTLAALGIVLFGVSGLILWWQRRPAGQLAAPVSGSSLPRPVLFGTLALAALLPLLAASLALIFIADRFILRPFVIGQRN